MMDQPLFWAYVAAVVGALGGGIVLMVRKHRSTGLGLVFVGSFLVLLPAGLVAWEVSPLSDSPHIQVEPLDPANEPHSPLNCVIASHSTMASRSG